MTRLSLLLLGLAALLGSGLAVDPGVLNNVVNQLLNRFQPRHYSPIFCLAVKVPPGHQPGQYDVNQVQANANDVRNAIQDRCTIFSNANLVAASYLKPDEAPQCRNHNPIVGHSEFRVLQMFHLQPRNQELMVFYSSASPCNGICTNRSHRYHILDSIKTINRWANRALVFTNIFTPGGGDPVSPDEMKTSLRNLGASVGRINIYRCYNNQCVRCFNTNDNNEDPDKFCTGN